MKKLLSIAVAALLSVGLSAQVAYLLPGNISVYTDIPTESVDFDGVTYQPNAELNAATWFQQNYVAQNKGVFVTMDDLRNGLDASIQVLWIHIDRVGADLGALGFDNATIIKIRDYAKAGLNIYFSKQATMLVYNIGRIGYAPSYQANAYNNCTDAADYWTLNPVHGIDGDLTKIDHSSHAIFAGLPADMARFSWKTYALMSGNVRSDNNCFWQDLLRDESKGDTHYDNRDVQRLYDFQNDWNCEALGTWGQIGDYFGAGLVDFRTDTTWHGHIVAMGLAAYQFSRTNTYIANVQLLTSNILTYLMPASPATSLTTTASDALRTGVYTLTGERIAPAAMQHGSLYIVDGKKVLY